MSIWPSKLKWFFVDALYLLINMKSLGIDLVYESGKEINTIICAML